MKMRVGLSLRAVVKAAESAWVASPTTGVEREILDRIGYEVARGTLGRDLPRQVTSV